MIDTILMESQKTSRTSLLNLLLLKAWRERWTDAQWGINIKSVLPRGVSGDVYNLADSILQQAIVGSNANQLILSYLKHSLCAHLISHAAVLKRISKYEQFDKIFCITSLLEFLETIMNGVTCRTKPEELILPNAMVSVVLWVMKIFSKTLESLHENAKSAEKMDVVFEMNDDQQLMLENATEVIERITENDFLLGILYIGKQEDPEYYFKIEETHSEVKNFLTTTGYVPKNSNIEKKLRQLAYIDASQLEMITLDADKVEPITYCVQPLLAVEVLLHPSSDTQYYVSELLMIQRLKNYSMVRLYSEIIRAGLISLSNANETAHDTLWCAFTFIKVPYILKQLNAISSANFTETLDHLPDVVEALKMIMDDTTILDFVDTKCSCNTIEYLLTDWAKQHLVNEKHIKQFTAKREPISALLQKRDSASQSPSIINYVIRAEAPLSGILKTLSTDYNKVQEALVGMLCQVLVGNSFDLILAVATAEGRLNTFVSRLIKCNENSKQVPGEVGKAALNRSTLFDVSFLMLTFIVQTFGSGVVLQQDGDSFFEKWVRECMVEKNKNRSPKNIIKLCDDNTVDELILTLRTPDSQIKTSNLTWQDICMNIPGVIYHVLIAWENDSISATDVKGILDSIKMRLFSFSVCAASYLCAYMQTVREDEFLKPINMVQQFFTAPDEMSTQENIKERHGLTFQIIRKMQHDIHPAGNAKIRPPLMLTQNTISQSPMEDQFIEIWKSISDRGWLPTSSAQHLETLLNACGPGWLVQKLVDEILKCRYTKDMMKIMDIVFAIMHLNIERTTVALLDELLPMILLNSQQKPITEPQSSILARLCVYCIISNLESTSSLIQRRSRSIDTDEADASAGASNPKIRKLNSEHSGDSSSNDFPILDHVVKNELPSNVQEPLQNSLQNLFKMFSYFVSSDELTPKIYFIFQFVTLLVECGKDRIKSILKLIPNGLVQNLLKILLTDDISVGLVCRLYDLRSMQGRQSAISDLCLLRNIRLRKHSIQL